MNATDTTWGQKARSLSITFHAIQEVDGRRVALCRSGIDLDPDFVRDYDSATKGGNICKSCTKKLEKLEPPATPEAPVAEATPEAPVAERATSIHQEISSATTRAVAFTFTIDRLPITRTVVLDLMGNARHLDGRRYVDFERTALDAVLATGARVETWTHRLIPAV